MPKMRVVKGGGDAADEVYTVPPSDFIRVRDARVRKLRSAGHDSVASALQRLRKPTAVVWALNQAARTAPANVRAFLSALERMGRAQLRQPHDLAPASETMRTALGRVVGDVRDTLQAAGTAWTPAMSRRVSETLRGAAADPAQRERLLNGRLNEEMTAPGFDVFGDARPTGTLRAVTATKKPTADVQKIERHEMMRRRAAELERESKQRDREAMAAENAAHEARTRLRELEARAKQARRKAREARRTARPARRE